MSIFKTVGVGYQYVIEHYMDNRQLDYYTERVLKIGLSESEKVLINYYFERTKDVLDVGTGCGRFAISAHEKGFVHMYGIDMSERFIERAIEISDCRKYDIQFSLQNAQCTTFKDNAFKSAIFTSNGFSQVPGNENKLAVLKEMYRIMEPGGILIITVIDENLVRVKFPAYTRMINESRRIENWKANNFYDENDIYIYDGGYMHFATIEETSNLIAKSGFKILSNVTAKDILGYNDRKSSNISRFFILKK